MRKLPCLLVVALAASLAAMDRLSIYKNQGDYGLGNTVNTADLSTPDHDGNALVLVATE